MDFICIKNEKGIEDEHLYNYSLEELTEYLNQSMKKTFLEQTGFPMVISKMLLIFKEMSNISKDLWKKKWKNNASLIPLKYKEQRKSIK